MLLKLEFDTKGSNININFELHWGQKLTSGKIIPQNRFLNVTKCVHTGLKQRQGEIIMKSKQGLSTLFSITHFIYNNTETDLWNTP
jgi:hypothetical protein